MRLCIIGSRSAIGLGSARGREPLSDLIVPGDSAPLPALALGAPADHPFPIVAETAPGVQAEAVLHGTPAWGTSVDGLAVHPDGRLLLTTLSGVVGADLGTGALTWAVPIPGCRRGVLVMPDGSMLVIYGEAEAVLVFVGVGDEDIELDVSIHRGPLGCFRRLRAVAVARAFPRGRRGWRRWR